MKLSSKKGIVLLIFISLILIAFAGKWLFNLYLNKKISNYVKEETHLPYHINYKNIEFSFFYTALSIEDITISSIETAKNSSYPNIAGSLKKLHISGIHPLQIIQGKPIELNSISIINPDFRITKKTIDSLHQKNFSTKKLPKLNVESFTITDGSILYENQEDSLHLNDSKGSVSIKQFDLQLKYLQIDTDDTLQKMPVSYDNLLFSMKEIHYDTRKFYDLTIDNIQFKDNSLSLHYLKLKPKYSRKKHVAMLALADDIFNLNANKIVLNNLSWHIDSLSKLNVTSNKLLIDSLNANIYRNKIPPFNHSTKSMFSKKLRNLPFGLEIDTTKITSSKLVYEEVDEKAIAPGKLIFNNFNATIKNIVSGYGKTKSLDTQIAVDAFFMNDAPLHVDWSFNVLNPSDQFQIRGTIKNFDAPAMNPFIKPYIKASTSGKLEYVAFNFYGNNQEAFGSFAMKHKDLKVTLYRADGKEKRALLTKIGNWFIREDSKGETKEIEIKKVERIQEKSFFNYLWLCILQGLKQTVL
ncbi:AsmA family protein [Myroides guanonis]|uniref:AsmA-like C-terminal region n=1 Tax=Myroides guanonis TaxID=1150112 RepID=A0A1I3Q626_9FLAO|nr:hypothetical protein [Myroides guanonis]SFJ28851.1 hypothetical protein SAMN04487893_10555 [Myroides guanonis]